MTTLANGVRVITETMPHVRSVSVGIWIGSRLAPRNAEQNGISHFIEHMLFKGTTNRSAEDIARSVDSIGGNLDAFTAKELVCFNTKVLDQHLSLGLRRAGRPGAATRCSARRISRRKRASSSKKSRWRRTARTTWSTRSSPPISGRIIRSASRFWARRRRSSASTATMIGTTTARSTRPPTCWSPPPAT